MQEKNIPLLDCPVDYFVGDASGRVLNEYARFPCKIMCGVYALIVRGSAKATINITQYDFKENDFLWLEPGSFLLIHEFTEDALVYFLLFSSSFMEKNTFSNTSFNPLIVKEPIMHLKNDKRDVIRNLIQVVIDASNCEPSMLSSKKMVHIGHFLSDIWNDMQNKESVLMKPLDRKQEIYQAYMKLVMEHYHEWHHVARYAEEIRVTLPHLCSTIKSVSGKTAGELIVNAIITDAKAQLKITNLQIKEIAINLGFDNVGFFNRFFKSHTGLTPKIYRNS